jgi:nucleoside-diphosphate kinase
MNLVHASDSPESATRELQLYFPGNQICRYTPTLVGSFRAGDEG